MGDFQFMIPDLQESTEARTSENLNNSTQFDKARLARERKFGLNKT